jgi:nicotinamidase-related amidase
MENQNLNTALLVMDVQPGIVDRIPEKDEYLARLMPAIDSARERRIPVIFVVVGFRPGAPEATGMFKERAGMLTDPRPVIDLEEGEVLVTKRRVSAFTGSDLEVILRAQGIRHLVLTGLATGGVVLSTLREAADKDYQLTVLSDLCADFDPEVHRLLVEKVFPRQAAVMTAGAWTQQA